MKLLTVLKSIYVVVCVAVLVNNVCAMQLVQYEDSAQKFINQFPSMTLEGACNNWKNLSPVAQQQIEKAEDKRNKGKSNWIFGMIKHLPPEVCALIVSSCYDNQCDHNENKKKFILTTPIKNVFGDMFIFNTSFSKLQANIYIKKIKKNNTIDDVTLFKLAEPITVLNRHCESNNKILPLEAVRSLEAIISEMVDQEKNLVGVKIKLNWYYAYTLANSISAFNKEFYDRYGGTRWDMFLMKVLSTMMVSCVLSRLVELYFCHKYIDQKILLKNEASKELNQFINQSAYAELLSDSLRPIKEPMNYSDSDEFKILLPSFLPIPILWQQCSEEHHRFFCFVIEGVFSFLACFVLNMFSFKSINNRVLFIGSAICLFSMAMYIIVLTMVSMWEMRQLKSKTIRWNEISELLKKHDDGQIVIL